MKLYEYPDTATCKKILQRPAINAAILEPAVKAILADVKTNGDEAIKKYTQQFDGVAIANLKVSEAAINAAEHILPQPLKEAIEQAAKNIYKFHQVQQTPPAIIETMPGIHCWRKNVAIEKVGLYIPGGSAPLFSTVLMLGIPATIAGCKEIVLCTPPSAAAGSESKVHPAILFAAKTVGLQHIFTCGGVQAVAAMAYGTSTISKVYKIFGPGNQYLTCAKQLVQQEGVAIDMPAGPSEVAIYADETANANFVAADLLSQAEHGADSQVLLISTHAATLKAVQAALTQQLEMLPRKGIAMEALENSSMVLVNTAEEAMSILNEYAPEHLILSCQAANAIAEKVVNAGSVFIGHFAPESVGDYASGTNHALPTNGYAKTYSGVSVDSFMKKITFQQLTKEGLLNIAPTVEAMAMAEGLEGHARAVRARVEGGVEPGIAH
jgi:histidinol dehydrogenase